MLVFEAVPLDVISFIKPAGRSIVLSQEKSQLIVRVRISSTYKQNNRQPNLSSKTYEKKNVIMKRKKIETDKTKSELDRQSREFEVHTCVWTFGGNEK